MSETTQFVRACALADVPDEGALGLEIDGLPVAVVRVGGEVPLSEGEIYDHTVECWLHGSCFDLRTGSPTGPPATEPVPVYPVKVSGGDVYVALPAS
jgi:3-phenylpropionate/trans-cinnamate dioxygenase ferredoxin subunit